MVQNKVSEFGFVDWDHWITLILKYIFDNCSKTDLTYFFKITNKTIFLGNYSQKKAGHTLEGIDLTWSRNAKDF